MAFRGTYVKFDACISTYSTCGLWHSKEDWGVNRCFFTSDWKSGPSSFQKKKTHYSFGDAHIAHKNKSTSWGGGLSILPMYTLRGESTCPSASIPGIQHQREGPWRIFKRKGPTASSKSDKLILLVWTCSQLFQLTFLVWTCSRVYDDMILLDHTMRPHLRALSGHAAPCHGPYHTRSIQESPFGNHRCVGRVIACDD